MTDNNIKLKPATHATVERLTEELKLYPTEVIEPMLRAMLKRDARILRRNYPELFRRRQRRPR